MAYLAPVNDVLNVWVGERGKEEYRPISQDSDRGIGFYTWALDGRHILYLQDTGGDENWHLHSVDLETGDTEDLTPFAGVQVRIAGYKPRFPTEFVFNKRFPTALLLQINKDDPEIHDVYRLDLDGGKLDLVAKNPGDVTDWIADRSFQLRACMRPRTDGGSDLLVRDSEDRAWRELLSWQLDDFYNSRPVGFDAEGTHLFVIDSRDFNAGRLVKIEVATGDTEILAEDSQYDANQVQVNPDTFDLEAVAFYRDRLEWKVLDPSVRADFDAIAAIQDGEFYVISRDDSDRNWLIAFTVDDGSTSYWSFHRSTRASKFLFDQRPELSKYKLAQMEPFIFTGRDGLEVHGYISFPPGVQRKGHPMVVYVHGGPWLRDVWGFHPTVQWLANRGYICLQVNYRGSTGYGKEFLNAGNREWGGKMQDDLLDAVKWAVSMGYADRSRVAIMGTSYGGYAALVGVTFTPDVFACAVSAFGQSNLKTFIETIPPYWKPTEAEWHARIGHPEKDAELLWSRSPLSKVDQIRRPLLIAHGKNDSRVKLSESLQIFEAMKKRGIEHEFLLFEDEGHWFTKPENRLKFYRAADRSLAMHLGGRAEE